jgi:hypothetical protein
MTQPVISPAATFRRSWQKSTSRPNPRIPRKCLSELLGSVPETTAHVVCSDTKSSNKAGTFPEEIVLQKMSAISLRSITCQNIPEKLCPNNFESIRELSGRIGERREHCCLLALPTGLNNPCRTHINVEVDRMPREGPCHDALYYWTARLVSLEESPAIRGKGCCRLSVECCY